jgi:hypothetical protein
METDTRPALGDLDENDLAAATMSIVDRVRPHLAAIVTIVAILFLGLAAFVFLRSQTRARQAEVWDVLLNAIPLRDSDRLQAIASDARGDAAGVRALIALGDMALSDGNGLLMRNPAQARKRLEEAVEFYAEVNAAGPRGIAAERGILGLARAQESLGRLEDARLGYEALVEEYPESPFAALAEDRLTALDSPATQRWYNWLESRAAGDDGSAATTEPAAATSAEPAQPTADAEPPAG